jgi:putative oxidoreductase
MVRNNRFLSLVIGNVFDNRSIFVRVLVGLIFLSEGIQKYIFLTLLGPGRFLQIGFNHPAFWSYFTGSFEIICGSLILLGLFTRLASIPLMIVMITAFITTKWPIIITKGFWVFAHEYRTDFAMTVLLVYLLIYGGGNWSLDHGLFRSVQKE